MQQPKVLIIDDDADLAAILMEILQECGYAAVYCTSTGRAEALLRQETFRAVLCDVHMPEKSGLALLQDLKSQGIVPPPFAFVTGNVDPAIIDRASRIGAIDVLHKPFDTASVRSLLRRLNLRSGDRLQDIMATVQAIAGIELGPEKRLVVETRVLRRANQLGLTSLEDYYDYFNANREQEVHHLVSLITTHTTDFFRESSHFDYLFDHLLPSRVATGEPLAIWSAACSTGEEVYSIAITYLEYLRQKMGAASAQTPGRFEVFGSDIDFVSIDSARNGVYEARSLAKLPSRLVDRYFDQGKGDLAGYIRIKDQVHRLCRFEQHNLLGERQSERAFDAIFLRNVLIYFSQTEVTKIATMAARYLKPNGLLFLGHSESLVGLDVPLELIGDAIYAPAAAAKSPPRRPSPANARSPVGVLVVDDSPVVRKLLRQILSEEHGFTIIGEAADPSQIPPHLATGKVDVMTLDVHMPVMDGVTYLAKTTGKPAHPPVVMLSSVSREDGIHAMRCLELGAFDFLEKPSGESLEVASSLIRDTVRAAARSRRRGMAAPAPSSSQDLGLARYVKQAARYDLIAIGSSTGGVEALGTVLTRLPPATPPILIVQHIPPVFSQAMAQRLAEICRIKVSEAIDGEVIEESHAYIAPGGRQMTVRHAGGKLRIVLSDDPPRNHHRPSVDMLFESIAELPSLFCGAAALLTGMGRDGASGLLALRKRGWHTIAQDEASSVVYGMPRAAAELGAAVEILPLHSVAYHLLKALTRATAA